MTVLILSFAFLIGNQGNPGANAPKAQEKLHFESDIRPIFKAFCLDCHGGSEKAKGGLDLRLKHFAVKGGETGAAIVVGQPGDSPLLVRMKQGEMPPGEKKVPLEQISLVERWIREGATTKRPEPDSLPPGLGITEEDRSWWAFVPLKKPNLESASPLSPIDQIVLRSLNERGLNFNPLALPRELLVRAALDLTGIPPTREEIVEFEKDKDPNRWLKSVDRLLASPAYGERWARHWLDLVGYADSEGDGSADSPRAHSWHYRDWVIRALNSDLPLDRFITEQMAGDELVPRPWNNLTSAQAETLAATGFLRMVPGAFSAEGAEQVVVDTIKVLSASFLGVSVGCAQCHDHRYDPISQEDYFRLRAIIEPALNPGVWRGPGQRLVSLYTDKDRAKAAEINAQVAKVMQKAAAREADLVREAVEKELKKHPEPLQTLLRGAFAQPADKRNAAQKDLVAKNPSLGISGGVLYQYNQSGADEVKKLRADGTAIGAQRPEERFVMVLDETGTQPVTRLFHRGDPRQPKGEVSPGDLTVLSSDGKPWPVPARGSNPTTSGRRLAYARHLTSGNHQLFGRVMANRIWMHHFGKGLVETPAEFGRLGQLPSHPELLDWLALELPAKNWSLKAIDRMILLSRTWQQSTRHNEFADKVDTNNALLHRYQVRRLEAEVLRDRILVAAGRLDPLQFGPPIPVVEHASGQIQVPEDKPRRSIYLQQRRSQPVAMLGAFDQPVNMVMCEKRVVATNAPQSLMLLNGEFVHSQAGHLAGAIISTLGKEKPGPKSSEKIGELNREAFRQKQWGRAVEMAWQKILLRDPTDEEKKLSLELLIGHSPVKPNLDFPSDLPEKGTLAHLTHQLLISNEFLHVP